MPSDLIQSATVFRAAVVAACPDLDGTLHFTLNAEGTSINARVASPTNDPRRDIVLWIQLSDVPSISFGEWHTHGDIEAEITGVTDQDAAIAALVAAIRADLLVLFVDVGGTDDGYSGTIDLRDADALAEYLTSKHSTGRVLLHTFTGRGDRNVSVDDL